MAENKMVRNYLEMKIKTATPLELVIMLYDKAISSLKTAIELIDQKTKKYDVVNNNILKAQEILSELMLSLDFSKGKEIAQNLYNIYDFLIKQCIDGNINKDSSKLKDVVKILTDLREAWNTIAQDPKIKSKQSSKKTAHKQNGSSFNVSI